MGGLYLGFDAGTQGLKGICLDLDDGICARYSVSYGLIEGLPDGFAEQHPQGWVDALQACAAGLLAGVDRRAVRGLAISGQQHGCVVLDEHDAVLRPAKLWCDTSTAAQAAALEEELGRPVPVGFTLSKLRWLAEREPENFARLRCVLLPHDYLNFRLTGRRCMEAGDASGTGWFDPQRRSFDPLACAAVGPGFLERQPELVPAGTVLGSLHRAGAELLGLQPGLPVATGGGDNMMSAIGAGAVRSGVSVLSMGTSGTVFTSTEVPVTDPRGLIAGFCNSHGGWLPLLCVMNLTGVTEELRQAFGLDHPALTAAAAQEGPGAAGLRWFPFLVGERVPALPQARGLLEGMGPGCLQPGRLYRAALEGTSLNLAWGQAQLQRLGHASRSLRLVGGAAANPLWQQILADVCEVDVQLLAETESAALGAAIQAAWTTAGGRPGQLVELCARFVEFAGEPRQPGENLLAYRQLREDYASGLRRHWGVESD